MNSPSPRGIVAGGNWLIDHVKILDTWPPQDALANILSESWGNGGSPYNVLKDLAKLGASFPLTAIGLVGADADGERILADCRRHRIETAGLRSTTKATTSYSDVMVESRTGRRTFFHQRGANARLGPEHFDFKACRAKILHLGYLLLLDRLDTLDPVTGLPAACAVLRAARRAGLVTSLDCVSEHSDRFTKIVRPVLPDVDVLFANDYEAEKLTGVVLRARRSGRVKRSAVEKAARILMEHGVRDRVVLHFPEAAYAQTLRGDACWQPSVRVPPRLIKGTAGAGDAFASGVLYGLHEDWSLADSLRLGVCTAASSLFDPTCSDGVRSRAACLRLGKKHGWQSLPA